MESKIMMFPFRATTVSIWRNNYDWVKTVICGYDVLTVRTQDFFTDHSSGLFQNQDGSCHELQFMIWWESLRLQDSALVDVGTGCFVMCCDQLRCVWMFVGNPLLQSIKLMSTFPIVINVPVKVCSQLQPVNSSVRSNKTFTLKACACLGWTWTINIMALKAMSLVMDISVMKLSCILESWGLGWSNENMTAALEFEIFYKITVKIDEMFPFQFWWQSQIKHKIKGTDM